MRQTNLLPLNSHSPNALGGPVDNEAFVLLMIVGVFAGFVDSVAIPFALANMVGGYLAPGYVLKYGFTMLRPMFLVVSAIMISVQIFTYFA